MPSPKKSVSPKKKTVSKPKMSPKKTVSRPKMSSPKKMTMSSKPKLTDTHKAIAAASLLALLGGGALAYKNGTTIRGAATTAYNKVMTSPADVRKWLGEQPDRVKTAYNNFKFTSMFSKKKAEVDLGNAVSPVQAAEIRSAASV